MTTATRRRPVPVRRVKVYPDALPARPFYIPPCAWCREPLVDSDGRPSWDVVGRLTFVCRGQCRGWP